MSSIAKSAILVSISEIMFNLSGFVIHGFLGRILGPADYGRYSLVITLTTMIIILIGNGIPTAMAKYLSECFETDKPLARSIKKQAIFLQIIVIGTITAVFFLLSPIIAGLLNDETLTPLFRLSTLIIPAFAAASFYFSYYTGLHKFNLQAVLKIIRSFVRVGFVVGLAYFFGVKGSIWGYVIAPTIVFLAALTIDKIKISKEFDFYKSDKKPQKNFDWKKLINYAWQIVVFFLAYELLISIDLYMVKALLQNDYLTGIYNAALTVGRIPYYIFYAMTIFLLPMISKSTARDNRTETKKILAQSLRVIFLLLLPMVILLSIFAGQSLEFLYGKKYAGGASAMSVLVFGVGFLTLFYVMSFAMNGAGKTKISMLIAMIGFVINGILNYILIPLHGIFGSAVATSIASSITMFLMLYFLHRDFDVSYEIKSIVRAIASGCIIFVISLFIQLPKKLFVFEVFLLFIVYFGILYVLREIKKEDIIVLQNIIRRKKNGGSQKELPVN